MEMKIVPGLLFCITLIVVIKKSDPTDPDERGILYPIDTSLGKKSCRDGFVHGMDYFEITGFVNVTGLTLFGRRTYIFIVLLNRDCSGRPYYFYRPSHFDWLYNNCTGIRSVTPINICQCSYENLATVRFKCNVSADSMYSQSPFVLHYNVHVNWSYYSNCVYMPKIYIGPGCELCDQRASRNEAPRVHGVKNRMFEHAHVMALALAVTWRPVTSSMV